MKKMSKILALVLSAILICSFFSGCGNSKQARELGKYTYWVSLDSRSQQTVSSYSELMMYKELAKKTGIEIDFIHPTSGSSSSEAFQILLTSNNMPDMVEYRWRNYAGGADAAIEDKVIISLNKYLKDYAPDYYDYMEGARGEANNGLYKAHSITQKGNYYGFSSLCVGNIRGFSGLYMRKDLLDKWGLDVPVTIDDWTEVFATAKKNGIKYPLTGNYELFDISCFDIFNCAWQVGKGFHVEDDKVILSVDTPAYKEYVAQMADWFKKGYIDPDYITNDADSVLGKITKSTSMAAYGYIGGDIGKIIPAMEGNTEIPDFELVACPYPVLKEGDKGFSQATAPESNDPTIAITVACGADNEERYKEAISWCNNLYTEEGKILKNFGVEGETFTKTEKAADQIGEDGEKYTYTYTSIISDDNDPGRKDINAYSIEGALYHFMRPGGGPGLNQHPDYLNGYYKYQVQKDAVVVWNQNIEAARAHVFPPVTYTDEENERRNVLWAQSIDKLNAGISNIILGKADISTYDKLVETAKKDGVAEILEIYQTALDRFNKLL